MTNQTNYYSCYWFVGLNIIFNGNQGMGGGNKTDKQMHKLSTDKWVRFYTLRERSEVKWMVGRNDYEIFFVSSSGITKNYYKEDIFVRRLLWVERTEDQKEGGLKSQ